MLIYTYNSETGEYVGSREAQTNPLDGGWLIPAHATMTAPPDVQDGRARCFLDGAWTQIEDHRGKIIYSTSTKASVVISDIGPIPDGYTLLVPGAYDSWSNGAWVTDTTAQETAERAAQKSLAINAIQDILDNKAKEYGFDSIHTAILNSNSTSTIRQARGQAFRTWYDAVWDFAEAEWTKQEAGTGTYTTMEGFMAAMPAFVAPG